MPGVPFPSGCVWGRGGKGGIRLPPGGRRGLPVKLFDGHERGSVTRCNRPKGRWGIVPLALAVAWGCGEEPVGGLVRPQRDADGSCSIPEDLIFSGGVGLDGIPALTDPELVSPDDPGASYVRPWDRVIGVKIDEEYFAVPHNVLWWHEVVNFDLFSTPLAVTYCPLTGSSMVFDRTITGGAEFGVSGLLYQNNLMLYDRNEERSLWPQMLRGARCGPRDGQMLEMVAAIEMRWDKWLELYPDTRVVAIDDGLGRDYQLYPYGDYESLDNPRTLFPQGDFDDRRPAKERVLAIPYARGGGIAFPFNVLDSGGGHRAAHTSVDGKGVVIFWDHDGRAAAAFHPIVDGRALTFDVVGGRYVDTETTSEWRIDGRATSGPLKGRELEPLPEAYVAFWFAWAAFVPDTELWIVGEPAPAPPIDSDAVDRAG